MLRKLELLRRGLLCFFTKPDSESSTWLNRPSGPGGQSSVYRRPLYR